MLQIDNLTFSYKSIEKSLFKDFSMTLLPGHIYGLLGPNGAGKSTLLYLMAGLLTPYKGQVLFDDTDVRKRLPHTMRDIFIVPDEYKLPRVSLTDYIRTNGVFYPHFSKEDMLHYLDVFGMNEDVNLGELSLGQGKKVFMSFAMAAHTKVLLMDEPTNGLDIPGKEQFRSFLTDGRTDDSIFVISTHQVKDIEQVLDHIVMFNHSKILADMDIKEISKGGETDLEKFFNEQMNEEEMRNAER